MYKILRFKIPFEGRIIPFTHNVVGLHCFRDVGRLTDLYDSTIWGPRMSATWRNLWQFAALHATRMDFKTINASSTGRPVTWPEVAPRGVWCFFGGKSFVSRNFGESPLKLSRYLFWKICWNLFGLLLGDSTNGFWKKTKTHLPWYFIRKGATKLPKRFRLTQLCIDNLIYPVACLGSGGIFFPCSAWCIYVLSVFHHHFEGQLEENQNRQSAMHPAMCRSWNGGVWSGKLAPFWLEL